MIEVAVAGTNGVGVRTEGASSEGAMSERVRG